MFVRYDSISDILKPSSDPGVTDYSRYAETGEINVNSHVVAAAVKPADVYQLDHITFTLKHKEVTAPQTVPLYFGLLLNFNLFFRSNSVYPTSAEQLLLSAKLCVCFCRSLLDASYFIN